MAKFILYGITGITWLVALVWFIVAPGFEPLLAFLGGCATLVGTFFLPTEQASAGGGPQGSVTTQGDNHGQQVGVNYGNMTQSRQDIHNHAPNQGAQGTFHGPVHTGPQYHQQGQQVHGPQYHAGGDIHHGEVNAQGADFSGAQGVNISGVTVNRKRRRDDQADADDDE